MVGAEAVAVAVEVDYDGTVEGPVEHAGGDGGVAEDVSPGGDASVRGQDDAGFEVALRDALEGGGGGFGGQREVAQFVQLCRRRHRSTPAYPLSSGRFGSCPGRRSRVRSWSSRRGFPMRAPAGTTCSSVAGRMGSPARSDGGVAYWALRSRRLLECMP